jgi:hypothetical protein
VVLARARFYATSNREQLLWYNKSRRTARVCPACQRVYRLGDMLSSPVGVRTDNDGDAPPADKQSPSAQLLKEQLISGLCASQCCAPRGHAR